MANTSSKQQQQGSKQAAGDEEELLDPRYDWTENADNFVLRIHLSGFSKKDFKVQVDGAGRLTVRGQRTDATRHSRLNKVFQLPATANLEDISGRFEAGVLTLTVPKKSKQEAPNKKGKDSSKPEAEHKEDMATGTKKPGAADEQAEANRGEPHQRKAATPAPAGSAAPTPTAAADKMKEQAAAPPAKQQAAAPPVDPDSLAAERAKRRAEEEAESQRANKAAKPAAAAAATRRRGFREELQGLAASDWAEGLLDTVKKNKEVIAVAVAAFSLGLFVSSRLRSRN